MQGQNLSISLLIMTQFQWLDHFYFAGAHCIACTQPANVFSSQSGFNSFISQPISKWTMGLSSPKSEDQKTLYMLVVSSSSFFGWWCADGWLQASGQYFTFYSPPQSYHSCNSQTTG
ncbi:hypothetical protein BJV78DRAFT_1356493 [Lactifluus subvellereus]|nr:hypothetical protein BJV78DRAFT_1356493 [Lactifluus subvellereus]